MTVAAVILLVLGIAAWVVAVAGSDAPARESVAAGDTEPSTEPSTARGSETTAARHTTTTAAPTTTTTTVPQPEMHEMPPVPEGGFRQGQTDDAILVYEYRLAGLHFDPGPVDGVFDASTRQAIEAVQKLYQVPPTGAIDEGVRFALSVFRWPEPLVPDGEDDRTEVDLDRQVLIEWNAGRIELITTVSTGSGKVFCGGHDGCQYATTPVGRFEYQWNVNGWRDGDLGRMYQPFYFNGGIAVHGYQSVPTTPASHGCVRIPMHIAEYFPTLVERGEPIYVLGTQAAPYGKAPSNPAPNQTVAPPDTTPVPETPPPVPETAPPVPTPEPGPSATDAPPVSTTPVTPPSTAAPTTAPPTTVPVITTTTTAPATTTTAPATTTTAP